LVPAPIFAVLPSRTRTSPERTLENNAAGSAEKGF
jgi:hypothetical protein